MCVYFLGQKYVVDMGPYQQQEFSAEEDLFCLMMIQ
jgi:hypothetical protein